MFDIKNEEIKSEPNLKNIYQEVEIIKKMALINIWKT